MKYTVAMTYKIPEPMRNLYNDLGKKKDLYLFEHKDSSRKEEHQLKNLYKENHFVGIKPVNFSAKSLFLDMDGTSIKEESLDFLIQSLHLEEKLSQITENAMQGKISFKKSYFDRMKLLKGVPKNALIEASSKLTLNKGIKELCAWFHKNNHPVFIVSGGLSIFCQAIANSLNASSWHANHPAIENDILTGETIGILVDTQEKKNWFHKICEERNLSPSDAVMIGDGANDREILSASGLAVGFHPREILDKFLDVSNQTQDHSLLIDFLEA